MDKSMVKGLVLGAVVATAGGAFAGYKLINKEPEFAEVLAVTPVMKTVQTPREECREEVITEQAPAKDKKRITGTLVGAVVGGIAGSQVGSGSGRDIATVAGAAAGGYAGNRIQKRMQENNTITRTEQRCETVYDSKQVQDGFDVRYRLGDQEATIHMDRDPGKRIPVRDGQLVLEPEAPQS
jgi:uncharacterized protein YcfJ